MRDLGLKRALVAPRRGQIIIAILLCALGFAAVTQVRTNTDDTNYAGYREQDLVDLLTALSATTEREQAQIAQLESTKASLTQNTHARQTALDQATKQLDDLRILAGTVGATGPGLTITITDPSNQVQLSSMLNLIEELRTAGAEAMSLNDQVRIIASTAIGHGNNGLKVGGVQLHSPYVLTVIGDPTTLAGAVGFARGPEYDLENDGATVTVAQQSQVSVRRTVTR